MLNFTDQTRREKINQSSCRLTKKTSSATSDPDDSGLASSGVRRVNEATFDASW